MGQAPFRANEWKRCVASKTLKFCYVHAKKHAWLAITSHTIPKFVHGQRLCWKVVLLEEKIVECKFSTLISSLSLLLHWKSDYHDNPCRDKPNTALIARFMGPTWGPSGVDRTQVGPMLAPWTLISGCACWWQALVHIRHRHLYGWDEDYQRLFTSLLTCRIENVTWF